MSHRPISETVLTLFVVAPILFGSAAMAQSAYLSWPNKNATTQLPAHDVPAQKTNHAPIQPAPKHEHEPLNPDVLTAPIGPAPEEGWQSISPHNPPHTSLEADYNYHPVVISPTPVPTQPSNPAPLLYTPNEAVPFTQAPLYDGKNQTPPLVAPLAPSVAAGIPYDTYQPEKPSALPMQKQTKTKPALNSARTPTAAPPAYKDGFQVPATSKYAERIKRAREAINKQEGAELAQGDTQMPAHLDQTPPPSSSASPKLYSLHRQYGMKPDAIPAPTTPSNALLIPDMSEPKEEQEEASPEHKKKTKVTHD